MARDRQRAKQRQAERRAARIAEREKRAAGGDSAEAQARTAPPLVPTGTDQPDREELLEQADLAVGAPPEDLGRSDTVLEPSEAPEEALGTGLTEDEFEAEEDLVDEAAGGRAAREARERRAEHGREREHGRVLTFLLNVVAELKRVQWPNRPAVTTLTGVVLGFVLIAGGYLGLLDAIFSRLIKELI